MMDLMDFCGSLAGPVSDFFKLRVLITLISHGFE